MIFIFRAPGCFYDTDPEIKGIQKEKEDAEYFKKILDKSVDVEMLTEIQN